MHFKEIASRFTGFSTPVFGVSWEPPEPDVAIARHVVAFLEDRRVLYEPSEMEIPEHCVTSVLEIRHFLTQEIGRLADGSDLTRSLRAMRAACRKFLDVMGPPDGEIALHGGQWGHWASWRFASALGEMRGVFGLHLARIATEYGLDVEDDLARILPGSDTDTADG